jgi:alanine dehydrogenase
MNIIIPKEAASELRVPMLPQNIKKLIKKGAKITI